jgi:hypothetical protein
MTSAACSASSPSSRSPSSTPAWPAQLLQAAEAIHRRAEAIQQWPFQQRRLVQMAGIVGSIVTFVITGIITRLVLASLGL